MKPEIQKLLWRARRGMLELDMLFRTYLERFGDEMTEEDITSFTELLQCQDQDLFDAFNGKTDLQSDELQQLFVQIQEKVG